MLKQAQAQTWARLVDLLSSLPLRKIHWHRKTWLASVALMQVAVVCFPETSVSHRLRGRTCRLLG